MSSSTPARTLYLQSISPEEAEAWSDGISTQVSVLAANRGQTAGGSGFAAFGLDRAYAPPTGSLSLTIAR